MLLRIIILFFLSVGNFVFAKSQAITFTIDLKSKAQTIENIGASGAWYSEVIGKNWTAEKKERMAELLFSKSFDSTGIRWVLVFLHGDLISVVEPLNKVIAAAFVIHSEE